MNKSKVLLPTVKKIVIKENNITFILSPSELYYQNMMVSVFYDEGEETSMALSLGVGYIETINEKGYIQVKFYSIHQDETVNKIFEKIKNENVKYSNIKIKPSVSYNDLEESR